MGKGARIGTGRLDANVQTATTNFLGALAQCEEAMRIFYAAGQGHLVVVSSVSAVRGMPSAMTTYGATKAGVAALADGIRSDVLGSPIAVTTLFPGYIRSEMNERVAHKVQVHGRHRDRLPGHGRRHRARGRRGVRATLAVGDQCPGDAVRAAAVSSAS